MTPSDVSSSGTGESRRMKGRVRERGREILRSVYLLPRLPLAHMGLCSLPSFVVIGAQKAGTTSLFRYLGRHPGVSPPRLKEIHFFDLHWDRGISWYRAHFPLHVSGVPAFTGEASPYYLFHPRVPERMSGVLPGAKILVLLRNPVDRAISHYHWEVSYGNETLSFRNAVVREAEIVPRETARLLEEDGYRSFLHQHISYLSRGRYAEQLGRWLKHFSRDRILVLLAEELFANPGDTMARVQDFLGLPKMEARDYPIHRGGSYGGNTDMKREELKEYFRPHNERLRQLLDMDLTDWE